MCENFNFNIGCYTFIITRILYTELGKSVRTPLYVFQTHNLGKLNEVLLIKENEMFDETFARFVYMGDLRGCSKKLFM